MNNSKPYQALTTTNASGDYDEIFEPVSDPLITKYLEYRKQAGHIPPAFAHPLSSSPTLRRLRAQLPFSPNLSRAEFVPTQLFSFLEILRDKFPLHHLLLSDFSSLPDTISGGGYNAPVVQTRYRDTMVPCSTYMVQPGYFDIFFPTDFELLRDMYELVMTSARPARSVGSDTSTAPVRLDPNFFSSRGRRRFPLDVAGVSSSSGRRNVYTHKDFLRKYSDAPAMTLRSGENPMLDYYSNVKFLF
jgi:Putative S-adenosyl-L-methionine-dependent methyltransferase